jgi:hypothetical protein
MSLFDYRDLGTDQKYCDGLSRQRCAHCHLEFNVSELVLVPGIGLICEECDTALGQGEPIGTEIDL